MEQIYTSKIDTWLAFVLISAMAVCVVAVVLPLRLGHTAAAIIALPALVLGVGLPVWLMMSTSYTLSDATLFIKSGPFKWTVPVDDISSVTPTSDPLSSPALSLDRLRIEYGQNKSVMISPKLKHEFLQDLETRRKRNGQ